MNAVRLAVRPRAVRRWADTVLAIAAATPNVPAGVTLKLDCPPLSESSDLSMSLTRTIHPGYLGGLQTPYFVMATDLARQNTVSGMSTEATVRKLVTLLREAADTAEAMARHRK